MEYLYVTKIDEENVTLTVGRESITLTKWEFGDDVRVGDAYEAHPLWEVRPAGGDAIGVIPAPVFSTPDHDIDTEMASDVDYQSFGTLQALWMFIFKKQPGLLTIFKATHVL